MTQQQQSNTAAVNLFSAIQHYQLLIQELRQEREAGRREQLRYETTQTTELIYHLLEKPCRQVVRKWMGSRAFVYELSDAMDYETRLSEATAWTLAEIFKELLNIQLDPSKNIEGLIAMIARRRLTDEYRKFRRRRAVVATEALDEQDEECVSYDPELDERIADAEEYQQQRQAILNYCHTYLTPVEQNIVELCIAEPPLSYAAVAERLGPPWNADNVRQRLCRIRKRMKQHFANEQ